MCTSSRSLIELRCQFYQIAYSYIQIDPHLCLLFLSLDLLTEEEATLMTITMAVNKRLPQKEVKQPDLSFKWAVYFGVLVFSGVCAHACTCE